MQLVILKTIHIIGAMMFLGAGAMSAYYKVRADRSGDPRIVAWYQREIVLADWLVTVPSGIILPVTGVWLARIYGLPVWSTVWIRWGIIGYVSAGLLWLPAAWLQIKMRRYADAALDSGEPLPPEFHRANRIWFALGVPSFLAAATTLWSMVAKGYFPFGG